MWTSRIRKAFVSFLFASVIAAVLAPARPAFSQQIRSVDDFNRAFNAVEQVLSGSIPNALAAQQIMEQALAWARANPGPDHADLIKALFRAGQVAALNKQFDRAEALFREDLAVLDASHSQDQAFLYQLLRRLLQLNWINGHGTSATDIAERFSRLGTSQLPRTIANILGARPIARAPGFGDREADEPQDRALRTLRYDLDGIAATLINVPSARADLAEAVITRNAAIQDVTLGYHVISTGQENHPPTPVDALAYYTKSAIRPPAQQPSTPLDMLRVNAAAMTMLAYADLHISPEMFPKPVQLAGQRLDLERQLINATQPNWQFASLDEIRRALPENSTMLAYATYGRPPTAHEPAGERRYLVVALTSQGVQSVADVGPAAEVDGLIAAACRALLQRNEEASHCSEPNAPVPVDVGTSRAIGQQLYNRLLRPVAGTLANTHDIIVSPDGMLNFIPFEMLVDADGKYLVSTHIVSYVQSAEEIPRWKTATPSRGRPVIIADPDYYGGRLPAAENCSAESTRGQPRKVRAAEDLQAFTRLCFAAQEAQNVREALPAAIVLTRNDATEEAVKGLFGPRILHIATHGYTLQKLYWPKTWYSVAVPMPWMGPDYYALDGDPMLHGGLVLAGANVHHSPGGDDDGLLSAREASLLNLNGTQLVVLSACDSGLGAPRAGDGVAGVRRGFALAGARAQTLSLWPVGDNTTAAFMRRYYQLLAEGRPNAEALALVKREALAGTGTTAETWSWAAFVTYGYPGALGK